MFVHIKGQFVHTTSYGSGHRVIVGIPGAFGTCEIWEQPFEILSAHFRTVASTTARGKRTFQTNSSRSKSRFNW